MVYRVVNPYWPFATFVSSKVAKGHHPWRGLVTSAPTLTSPPAKLVLTFECKGDFNPSSTHEKVCVHTLPGASLTIKVTYCTGSADQSTSLKGTFTADKTGRYGWSWTPKAICQGNPPGAIGFWKGTAEVTTTLGGQHLTSSVSFIV